MQTTPHVHLMPSLPSAPSVPQAPSVSVIIPSYNRFPFLLNALESVLKQTYAGPIQIIVVNDGSRNALYRTYAFGSTGNKTVEIVHLIRKEGKEGKEGILCSRAALGHGSPAYARNVGLRATKGEYIAFLDDDDVWLPTKLEVQIGKMVKTGHKMSCTDGYGGVGPYNPTAAYVRFNAGRLPFFRRILDKKGMAHVLKTGFPIIWNRAFLQSHNFCVTSSVVLHRSIVQRIGHMDDTLLCGEDYDYWMRALQSTDCLYLRGQVLFYYDDRHGKGRCYTAL